MDNEIEVKTEVTERRAIPKNAFDAEYMTEFLREVRFLKDKGINHTFVKKTPDYGISQYKYKKTPALFAALVEFYSMIEAERNVRKRTPELTSEQIKYAQEVLQKAAEQIKEKDDTL